MKQQKTTQQTFHPVPTEATYISVVLPIAIPKVYTYIVPEELVPAIQFGVRVEVQFGKNKLYAALVVAIHHDAPTQHKPKSILAILDEKPIIHRSQFKLWQWMADYYCCTLGEVMNAALPIGLKINSDTIIELSPLFDDNFELLNNKEYLIAEALTIQKEIKITDVQRILNQKNVSPIINKLLQKRVVYVKEELKKGYQPKKVICIRLKEPYASDEDKLGEVFEKIKKAHKQEEALLAYLTLRQQHTHVRKQAISKKANITSSVIGALEKKGVFESYKREISRLKEYDEQLLLSPDLSEQQKKAIDEVKNHFQKQSVVLLHGVTGSGKTRVYIELIQDVLKKGGQVLYLIPEIALTVQIVSRLQKIFGDEIMVYNSRLNDNERTEIWKNTYDKKRKLILGARSALFLPFQELQLLIVDEEHDASYKQVNPAPRYSARDTAVMMSHLYGAKLLLGTATPSIESYHNTKIGKYALVEMPERFGEAVLPEIIVVDKRKEYKERKMQSHFTSILIEELKNALERKEQAILFQNRRGHSPVIRCNTCGWHQECVNCDVSLTYHKFSNNLRCHYCGYQSIIPSHCPACGNAGLTLKGLGTEKIEDEIKIYLPEANVKRMDFDTVRTKNAHAKLIHDFEERQIDILVGTQMVTKGLDFDNVGIVGILSADHLLQFPDFRAAERAFQLMTQVSGRAGRKQKQGKVIIQAFEPAHPVIHDILNHNFHSFFKRELKERHTFSYPPFHRLIQITLKHKKPQVVNEAAYFYTKSLKAQLSTTTIIGPAIPSIPRVRTYYLMDVLIKMPRNAPNIAAIKSVILNVNKELKGKKGLSSVRININVDPN